MSMKEERISVIMSAYNAEKTIRRAILSIENQTYRNLEIIVVDDCSTDNTKRLVKGLIGVYSNIILVEHNRNKGAGLARRSGIEHATGDYIAFVDSDDEICRDYYTVLHGYLKRHDADIIWSSPLPIYSPKQKTEPRILKEEVHTGLDIVNKSIELKKWLIGTISRRSLWDNVVYSDLRYIEDTPTMYRLHHYCKKGILLHYKGYYYYQHSKSLCHTANKLKGCVYRTLAMIEMLEFDERTKGSYSKKAFVMSFKELGVALKESPIKEVLEYRKELFRIYQYFTFKII